MKRYFLFFFFLFVGTIAFAQDNDRGAVTVLSQRPVMIAIDNRLYDLAGTELTIGNIPQGRHNLKIYGARTRRGQNRPGYLLFETNIRVRAQRVTLAQYQPNRGMLRVSQQPMDMRQDGYYRQSPDRPSAPDYGHDEDSDDANYRAPEGGGDTSPERISEAPAYQLSQSQLTDLRHQITPLPSDTKKKEQLQSVLGMKTYTVAQLREMTGWLNFESEKLDFLKWAYTNTEDKAHYPELYELFRYESSKKELRDYIAQLQ